DPRSAPCTETCTPGSGWPFWSVTLPEIVPCCCAADSASGHSSSAVPSTNALHIEGPPVWWSMLRGGLNRGGPDEVRGRWEGRGSGARCAGAPPLTAPFPLGRREP